MTFKDILKKSFLEGYASSASISLKAVLFCFMVTALIGAYIFLVYGFITKKTFYDKAFNISLPLMAITTSAIILTIQYSVVVSLGMVGALSIVRFRTAIKSPIDLVFLFWAISCGIICGAGIASIAVILSIVMTIAILIFNAIPAATPSSLVVVNADNLSAREDIISAIKKYSPVCNIQAFTAQTETIDMVVEVKPSDELAFIESIKSVSGVTSVSLVKHDGDVTF